MKKLLLITLYLIYHITLAFPQSSLLDSLFTVLETVKEDTTRVGILHSIGRTYYLKNEFDSASIYIDQAIRIAELKHLNDQKTKAIHLKGLVFQCQWKDSLAIEYLQKAKIGYEKAGKTYDQFYMHLYLGNLYSIIGSIQLAVNHFDSAEINMSKNNLKDAYDLNWYLGGFFWRQKKYEKARQNYLNTIELSRQMNDSLLLYYAFADLGSLYNDLQQPDSAIFYLEMVLPVIKIHDLEWASCLQGCLGTNYKSIGNCRQALDYFQQSLTNTKKPNESFTCLSFAEMASCYLHEGDLEKAKYYNDLSISLLDKASDLKLKRDAFIELVSLYKKQGDFERAFLNLENLKILEDTLFKTENQSAIEELQLKYQTREQETLMELQNLRLNRQGTIIILAVALLTLLSTILLLAWRNMIIRKKANQLLSDRNQQLKELDLKKSRFFSNISHELRTPLTLITAPLENTLEKVKDPETKADLELAQRNSLNLLRLVDEILELSKLENGQMKTELIPVLLENVTRRIFFAFKSLADIRKITLDFSSSLPESIWVKTDLPKLEKILNNLISNAVKYSDQGGNINLDISLDQAATGKETFVVQLADTGQGIPQDELSSIFDRFYQSNSGQLVGGVGIGLALTRELVHLFGGTIRVKSELGKGSTFSINLPLMVVEAPSDKSHQKPVQVTSEIPETLKSAFHLVSAKYKPALLDGPKPKILIVEDNPEMARFLSQSLSFDYKCSLAYDGKEAMQHLESTHFDLVTSDVMMPQMDGFEFLEKVRQKGTIFSKIPFILLTARTLEKDKLDGFELGVDDYITKPFSVKELKARIQNLLKTKQVREGWKLIENVDDKTLKTAEQIVLDHLSDSGFSVGQLSASLALSQRSLERLMKRLAGLSPVGFIREIRLQKAYQLLKRKQFLTVAEVRFSVGFENASYFNRKFKERFGINPTEAMKLNFKQGVL